MQPRARPRGLLHHELHAAVLVAALNHARLAHLDLVRQPRLERLWQPDALHGVHQEGAARVVILPQPALGAHVLDLRRTQLAALVLHPLALGHRLVVVEVLAGRVLLHDLHAAHHAQLLLLLVEFHLVVLHLGGSLGGFHVALLLQGDALRRRHGRQPLHLLLIHHVPPVLARVEQDEIVVHEGVELAAARADVGVVRLRDVQLRVARVGGHVVVVAVPGAVVHRLRRRAAAAGHLLLVVAEDPVRLLGAHSGRHVVA